MAYIWNVNVILPALEVVKETRLCQCAEPAPMVEVRGHMWIGPSGVEDDFEEYCTCLNCGKEILPDMILANTPGLEEAISADIQF